MSTFSDDYERTVQQLELMETHARASQYAADEPVEPRPQQQASSPEPEEGKPEKSFKVPLAARFLFPNASFIMDNPVSANIVTGAAVAAGHSLEGMGKYIRLDSDDRGDYRGPANSRLDTGLRFWDSLRRGTRIHGPAMKALNAAGVGRGAEYLGRAISKSATPYLDTSTTTMQIAQGLGSVFVFPIAGFAEYLETYNRNFAMYGDPAAAHRAGVPVLVVNTALEFLGIGRAAKVAMKLARITKPGLRGVITAAFDVLGSGATEYTTEYFQAVTHNAAEMFYDTETDTFDRAGWRAFFNKLTYGAREQAEIGGYVGLVMPIAGGGAVRGASQERARAKSELAVGAARDQLEAAMPLYDRLLGAGTITDPNVPFPERDTDTVVFPPTDEAASTDEAAPATRGPLRDAVESALKSRGVEGDSLLTILELADELAVKGADISADGLVTLYHRTTSANAEAIVREGKMVSKGDQLFFGTRPTGQIDGYGDAVVRVQLPIEELQIEDVFPEGDSALTNTGIPSRGVMSGEVHITIQSDSAGRPVAAEVVADPAPPADQTEPATRPDLTEIEAEVDRLLNDPNVSLEEGLTEDELDDGLKMSDIVVPYDSDLESLKPSLQRAIQAQRAALRRLKRDYSPQSTDPAERARVVRKAVGNIVSMVNAHIEEFGESDHTQTGIGWYSVAIDKMESFAMLVHPELRQEEHMILFKALLASTSTLVNPNVNYNAAMEIYTLWKETGFGRLPEVPPQGMISVSSGEQRLAWTHVQPESEIAKLNLMLEDFGSIKALAEWLNTKHEVGLSSGAAPGQLRRYSSSVTGVAGDVKMGYEALGPKHGEFFAGLTGRRAMVFDLWFTRTWHSFFGTGVVTKGGLLEELAEPRTAAERENMRLALQRAANKLGMNTEDVQAVLWYAEQHAWGERPTDYGTAAERNIDEKNFERVFQNAAGVSQADRGAQGVGQTEGPTQEGGGGVQEAPVARIFGSINVREPTTPEEAHGRSQSEIAGEARQYVDTVVASLNDYYGGKLTLTPTTAAIGSWTEGEAGQRSEESFVVRVTVDASLPVGTQRRLLKHAAIVIGQATRQTGMVVTQPYAKGKDRYHRVTFSRSAVDMSPLLLDAGLSATLTDTADGGSVLEYWDKSDAKGADLISFAERNKDVIENWESDRAWGEELAGEKVGYDREKAQLWYAKSRRSTEKVGGSPVLQPPSQRVRDYLTPPEESQLSLPESVEDLTLVSEQVRSGSSTDKESARNSLREELEAAGLRVFHRGEVLNDPAQDLLDEMERDGAHEFEMAEASRQAYAGRSETGVITLGVGISDDFVEDEVSDLVGKEVRTPADLAAAAHILRSPRYETFRVFFLRDGKVVGQIDISNRLPSEVQVVPFGSPGDLTSRIQEGVTALQADEFYVMHNHPTGEPVRSEVDVAMTNLLVGEMAAGGSGGAKFSGHIILNHSQFGFYDPATQSWGLEDNPAGVGADPALTPSLDHPLNGLPITSHAALWSVADAVNRSENIVTIFYLDAQKRIRATEAVDYNMLLEVATTGDVVQWLKDRRDGFGGETVALAANADGGLADALFAAHKERPTIILDFIVMGEQMKEGWQPPDPSKERVFEEWDGRTTDRTVGFAESGAGYGLNLVQGDRISFTLPVFTGSWKSPKHAGDADYTGVIEKDWYDKNRKHWFSVRLDDGKLKRVQGKNLYSAITAYDEGADHAEFARLKDQRKGVGFAESGTTYDSRKPAVYYNFAHFKTSEDIKDALEQTINEDADAINAKRGGETVTFEQMEALADDLNLTVDDLMVRRKDGRNAMTAAESVGYRKMLAASTEHLVKLAKVASAPSASDIDIYNFERMRSIHYAIQSEVLAAQTEAARVLASHRIDVASDVERQQMLNEAITAQGGSVNSRELAMRIAQIDAASGAGGVSTMVRKSFSANFRDVFFEVWINGLLSGVRTQVVNVTSNLLTAIWAIPERAVTGVISEYITGGDVRAAESRAMFWGMLQGIREGWVMAGRALKTGETQFGVSKLEVRDPRAIRAEAFGLDAETYVGLGVDMLGHAVRVPGRLLVAGDDFFKSVAYRQQLHALAYRTAASEGLEGDAEKMAERMQQIIDDPPASLRVDAQNFAAYQTFTNELGKQGQLAQRWVNTDSGLGTIGKLVLPFMRTPVNITKYAFQRTPLAVASKNVRADLRAGGSRAAQAYARMAMGSSLMATTAGLVAAGVMTGGGPPDKRLRKFLYDQGWKPYAIKIFGRYYQFNRLDPLGLVMSFGTDVGELIQFLDEPDADEMIAGMTFGYFKVMAERPYVLGLARLLAILDHGNEYKAQQFLQRFTGTLIPFSTLVSSVERAIDPEMRDVRGTSEGPIPAPMADMLQSMINSMWERTPLASGGLPVRRDIWGEELDYSSGLGWIYDFVSPVGSSEAKPDAVSQMFIDNRVAIDAPSPVIGGVKLTGEEYSRYSELAGKGAKAALDEYSNTGAFAGLTTGPGSQTSVYLRTIVNAERAVAREQVKREFPKLRARMVAREERRFESLLGGATP